MRWTVISLVLVFASSTAEAFHTPSVFDDSASDGGGQRMYFTGSPRQKGYDCGICHVGAANQISAQVALSPAADGAYKPGQAYVVTVTLVGEHRGFGAASNQNSFLAEAIDDIGSSMGSFTTPDQDTTRLIDDGRVVGGVSTGTDTTTWTFGWTAPAAGRGAVTMHVGLVDGDGASSPTELTDPGGDDYATTRLRMCEGTAGCADRPVPAPTESRVAGCSAGTDASPLVAIAIVLWFAMRRRRVAWLACLLVGCFDPSTNNECPDRVCGGPAGGTVDASSCTESWACTTWEAPAGSDLATRTCVDKNQRGTTACKPAEGPVTLPALDMEMFKCDVQPILQRGCSMMGCHGTNTGRPFRSYARGRLRNDEIVTRVGSCLPATGTVNLDMAGTGTIMCEGWLPHTATEWKKNFDSARSFMLDAATPEDSLMLRMPTVGGLPHIDIKLFTSSDPQYTTLKSWLGGAVRGSTCNTGKN